MKFINEMSSGCCSKFSISKLIAWNHEDISKTVFFRALLAEFVGTMILVLVGCGTCLGNDWETYRPTIVQISLAFGLTVSSLVWCLGHVSGGHINPAVTLGMLAARKISLIRALSYIIVQCAGATVGAALLRGLTPEDLQGSLGMTTISPSINPFKGFGVEFLITFFLVLTVFACCDGKRTDLEGSRPLTIGIVVTACHLFAIKYTGSSMNPARSFGPALIKCNFSSDYWVYWCGPLLGGVAAGLLYELVFSEDSTIFKFKRFVNYRNTKSHNLLSSLNPEENLKDLKSTCKDDFKDENDLNEFAELNGIRKNLSNNSFTNNTSRNGIQKNGQDNGFNKMGDIIVKANEISTDLEFKEDCQVNFIKANNMV